MSDRTPIPLTPSLIGLDSPEFTAISGWPFADPFVDRLLSSDVPRRVHFGSGRIWTYRDPAGRLAGFGTIDVCHDYQHFTAGKAHPYIPLLAVNPTIESLGYGTTIVRHLIDEAALLASRPGECQDILFLDVYTNNAKGIAVYTGCGFACITDAPISDPQEGGKTYIVMAKRVTVAPAQPS